jgi:bacillithiol biosynthesis deacetylase BshB1
MPPKTYDLLAVGAHPDDVEVGAGGVLADQAQRGRTCAIVVLTRGELGTGGDSDTRAREIEAAAHVLGADVVRTFDWRDSQLADTYQHRLELAAVIRQTRPRVLLAPYPRVGHGRRQSHPDHVAAGLLAVNAVHLAALKKADLPGEPHLVTRLFHYFLPPGVMPDFVVDISDHFEKWITALSAHQSQFLNPEKSKDYLDSLTAMARSFGLMARCRYGQGFATIETVQIKDIMALVEGQD